MNIFNENSDIIKYLISLQNNNIFINEFINLYSRDSFMLSKMQEQLIIDNSNNLLDRLSPTYKSKIFDSELDLKFGDFIDVNGNYYDLKVGNKYCGGISKRSLVNFGNTNSNRHYYICTKNDWSKIYIINAKELNNECLVNNSVLKFKKNNLTGELFLGEKDYSKSNYSIVVILDKGKIL